MQWLKVTWFVRITSVGPFTQNFYTNFDNTLAFGHCGDITTAVQIMDEMTYNRLPITTESFNFLLHACISLPKDGFTHAVQVRITFGIF